MLLSLSRAGLINRASKLGGPRPSTVSILAIYPVRGLTSTRSILAGTKIDKKNEEKTAHLAQKATSPISKELSRETGTKFQAKAGFDTNSIFILSIPVTTHRTFLYCHHNQGLLSKSQLDAVPWLVKTEQKLVGLSIKAWDKMVASELSINKKIVALVQKTLDSIPYNEDCLRSFPSKDTMVRETTAQRESAWPNAVMTSEIDLKNIPLHLLKPVPVYHPKIQHPGPILDQMNLYKTELVAYHRKWAISCAIGIPITLPLALLPVAPNVPGFYLAYRLYCHIQALRGAKNLGFLLEGTDSETGVISGPRSVPKHLTFEHKPELDVAFLSISPVTVATNKTRSTEKVAEMEKSEDTEKAGKSEKNKIEEKMLIDSDAVDKLVQATGLAEMKTALYRAFKQEHRRLQLASESEQ